MGNNKEEKNCCKTCSYFYHDDEMLEDDYVCVNHKSNHVADYIFEGDSCECWEENNNMKIEKD